MSTSPLALPDLIVGIGASAGGVEALKDLAGVLPAKAGIAFVVVQHLQPHHVSHMAEILGKCTNMTVVQVEDGVTVLPNCIYTNPAGQYVSIASGKLVLTPQPENDRVRRPIDTFLASLAGDQGDAAACIILSGSGTDGTRGLRAVHEAGGLCIAQRPDAAQYPAMPCSAIATGMVDEVMSLNQMPATLAAYAAFARNRSPREAGEGDGGSADELESILTLMRVRAGSDYRHYKKATVIRRIQRRMALKQVAGLGDYHRILREDQDELTQLSRDMLIGVSSFLRDPEAFDELYRLAIVPLVTDRDADRPIRVWVPGCATGEEAYTVAMLLLEATAAAGSACRVQVFASDVDDRALDTGRTGVYAANIAAAISPERLARFFEPQGEHYKVEKRLRETVVFSRQDLLADPPFSRLDLISCRNLLIYIEPAAQKKILAMFRFVLNPDGYLFLGKSEGVAEMHDLFAPVSKPKRIYRPIGSSRRAVAAFPFRVGTGIAGIPPRKAIGASAFALMQANQSVLLRRYEAAVLLVDPQGQILHFFGETERYLGHAKGPASLNVMDMVPGLLAARLRKALERVQQQDEIVEIPNVAVSPDGTPLARLTVMRAPTAPDQDPCLAIIFEDTHGTGSATSVMPASLAEESLVNQLENELKTLRNQIRAEAEGYEIATEELRAANEEVVSMNEEMQSANEELESSKEELQSLNEELSNVNNQLSEKIAELTAANNDLANLFGATEIATVFLDSQLRIKRFTPRATELLNLIPADIGRPISHITQNFDGKELAAESEYTLRTLAATDKEVSSADGRWYTMRILPYRTHDDRIDGVVITFSDVTRLRRAEKKRRELENRMLHSQKLESLGVLAGGIAHDFNNILAAVMGNLDLALLESPEDTPARTYIENTVTSTQRAVKLVEQMLAYAGGGVTEFRRMDLNGVVEDLQVLLAASISKKVPLAYRLADRPLPIMADASQLSQVIMNLVVNAAEAGQSCNGTITVATSELRADRDQLAETFPDGDLPTGHYAQLEVMDTGGGMEPATVARVFEPFFTTKFTGRGLGLSAVEGIVKSHRGAIAVASVPGEGSVFRVILPLETSAATEQPQARESEGGQTAGTGTILVVDDEPAVRDVTAAILRRSGYTVLIASDGKEGVEAFRRQAAGIDLVLLDVTMPGMTVEVVLDEMKAIRDSVSIVLCSGFSEHDISGRFAGKDVIGYIQKPFTMTTLVSRIDRWL